LRTTANVTLLVSLAVGAAALPSVAHAAELNLAPDWKIVLADLVVFGLLIYPVNRLLIRPLLRLADAREHGTHGSFEAAGELTSESTKLGAELEAHLAQARARAAARRNEILTATEQEERALLAAASADASRTIDAVRTAIAGELADARDALQRDTAVLAREAAAQLLGRPLT